MPRKLIFFSPRALSKSSLRAVGKADQVSSRIMDASSMSWIQLRSKSTVPNLGCIRHDDRTGRLVSRIRKICRIARPVPIRTS